MSWRCGMFLSFVALVSMGCSERMRVVGPVPGSGETAEAVGRIARAFQVARPFILIKESSERPWIGAAQQSFDVAVLPQELSVYTVLVEGAAADVLAGLENSTLPPAATGMLSSIPPGLILGVTRSNEVVRFPLPINPERLERFSELLVAGSLDQRRRELTPALQSAARQGFEGTCGSPDAPDRRFALFLKVCFTCGTGDQLRQFLDSAAKAGARACVALLADYKLLAQELVQTTDVEVGELSEVKEPTRSILFEYSVLDGRPTLIWD